MRLEIAVVRAGLTLASEILVNPTEEDATAAIARVCAQARRTRAGPLWPFQIVVREAD
ncbi:hypothetical protein [Methylobacterium nodulans]|uniref:Uncharacterized protein n=1 Tax=Methylobacterium nodulans (strain LMG 21967 / CNCM I-2342 / ORS 2060) TaxID=460265 RepID=B8IUI3_METNO|nr:hypothetical protein [Methylobacterium nodulans]ACL57051.1 hypothetical protein Mnod_2066 [Methylobacterium nodulans ORS 2060]